VNNEFLIDYFFSFWGISVNTLVLLVCGLASYSKYARRWGAISGEFSVPGQVTRSVIFEREQKRGAISYSYYVNDELYSGEIAVSPLRVEEMVAEYPVGRQITVYYSPRDPGFSRADKPPSRLDIIGATLVVYFVLPFLVLNFVAGYFYGLGR